MLGSDLTGERSGSPPRLAVEGQSSEHGPGNTGRYPSTIQQQRLVIGEKSLGLALRSAPHFGTHNSSARSTLSVCDRSWTLRKA